MWTFYPPKVPAYFQMQICSVALQHFKNRYELFSNNSQWNK